MQALNRIKQKEARDRKDDHRDRVAEPVLLLRGIDARKAVEAALDRSEDGAQHGEVASEERGDEIPERDGASYHQREHERDLRPADERH